MAQGELSVGELSAMSGVPVSTLHFYDKRGLIPAHRTAGNQRRYPRTVLARLALIRIAQGLGVPLAEIGAALPQGCDLTPREWRALLDRWQADLHRRISVLQELSNRAAQLSRCDCVRDCAAPAFCTLIAGLHNARAEEPRRFGPELGGSVPFRTYGAAATRNAASARRVE